MPSDHILQTKSRHRPSTSQGFVGIEVGRYGRNYFKKGKDARLNTLEGVIKKVHPRGTLPDLHAQNLITDIVQRKEFLDMVVVHGISFFEEKLLVIFDIRRLQLTIKTPTPSLVLSFFEVQ